jgi:hypothetical protein
MSSIPTKLAVVSMTSAKKQKTYTQGLINLPSDLTTKKNCDMAIAHYIITNNILCAKPRTFYSQESSTQCDTLPTMTNHPEGMTLGVLSLIPHIFPTFMMNYGSS